MNNIALKTSDRRPIVQQCVGCDRVAREEGGKHCSAFAFPDFRWRQGACSMATHIKVESPKVAEKVRVGQQKQKKK